MKELDRMRAEKEAKEATGEEWNRKNPPPIPPPLPYGRTHVGCRDGLIRPGFDAVDFA